MIDSRKLSPEASLHAAQNERLPVRAVIQVLFCEQSKLNRHVDWSGSFNGTRSPNPAGLEGPVRIMSKREMNAQQMEVKKLKEELLRVQSQCVAMQMQMEKLVDKKKGFFRWKKLGIMPSLKSSVSVYEKIEEEREANFGRQTPIDIKPKPVRPPKWRKSMS